MDENLKERVEIMQLGLKELDPVIAQQISQLLSATGGTFIDPDIQWKGALPFRLQTELGPSNFKFRTRRKPLPHELKAFQLATRRRDYRINRIAIPVALAALAVPFNAALEFYLLSSNSIFAHLPVALAVEAAATLTGVAISRANRPLALDKRIDLCELQAVSPRLTLRPVERYYVDALIVFSQIQCDQDSEAALRETLSQLNRLLDTYRDLERRREGLLSLMGTHVESELDAQIKSTEHLLSTESDPQVRETLVHNLKMFHERSENAATMRQNLQRMQGQQESVMQTMITAQSAVARLYLAPRVDDSSQVERTTSSVQAINQHTRAVEEAIEEVLTLGKPSI